ncbi:uncharacterized protein [Euwallacea similis]|uniref:uncharacterized protein n=1 Tax=Euwallacea similis TaxID=1736056 RepID=UPI0034511077
MKFAGVNKLVTVLVAISIFCCSIVSCEDTVTGQDTAAQPKEDDDNREGKYMSESWHAIHAIPEGTSGWIPRDSTDNQGTGLIKRRRLRKRKRRPPVVSYLDQNTETTSPKITEQQVEHGMNHDSGPWEELLEESVRPYVRRKVTPAYQSQKENIEIITSEDSSFSPLSASIQFGSAETPELQSDRENVYENVLITKKPQNLKEILKQNGGLSLSEILQKKNITLAELLMGNEKAIKALTTKSPEQTAAVYPITSTTQKNPEIFKYKRVLPSVALRKANINRKYETSESLSNKETMEAQRKRLNLLQSYPQNGKFADIARYGVIIEPTTEIKPFISTSIAPAVTTSINENTFIDTNLSIETVPNEMKTIEKINTSTTTTPKVPKASANKQLPLTSAKLMKMTTKKLTTPPKVTTTMETIEVEEENYPKQSHALLKPIKINVKEVMGFPNSKNAFEDKVTDGPLHMIIDLDNLENIPTKIISTTTSSTTPTTTTTTINQETTKLTPHTAKEEILQLLKDPRGRAGLSRILEQRNMTIEELIAQRERGSSQLHLADIFHNNTREPEPVEEPLEGKVSSEIFTNFPLFMRRPKELVIEDNATEKTLKNSFHSFKVPTNFSESAKNDQYFPWQRLYPELFNNQNQPKAEEISKKDIVKLEPADILTEEDLRVLEEIDQTLYSSVSNEELNAVDEPPRRLINISPGVKSAIVASLAIIVLSMIVFVTILMTFRWMQRKKKQLKYNESLKPSLISVKHRNIKTFVAETLRKNNANYYKRHMQSMSDNDSWHRESQRKNVY